MDTHLNVRKGGGTAHVEEYSMYTGKRRRKKLPVV